MYPSPRPNLRNPPDHPPQVHGHIRARGDKAILGEIAPQILRAGQDQRLPPPGPGVLHGLSQQLERCCCEFNRRLDGIECDMLKQPRLSGLAATCNGQLVPAIFRNDCGNCFGRNRDI